MKAEDRKKFAEELLQADFTQAQLEKYLGGSMTMSPLEYKETMAAIRSETGGDDPEGDQGAGSSEKEMSEYLADRFPETQKAE